MKRKIRRWQVRAKEEETTNDKEEETSDRKVDPSKKDAAARS